MHYVIGNSPALLRRLYSWTHFLQKGLWTKQNAHYTWHSSWNHANHAFPAVFATHFPRPNLSPQKIQSQLAGVSPQRPDMQYAEIIRGQLGLLSTQEQNQWRVASIPQLRPGPAFWDTSACPWPQCQRHVKIHKYYLRMIYVYIQRERETIIYNYIHNTHTQKSHKYLQFEPRWGSFPRG